MLEETQESKGKISVERRFFISSLDTDAEKLANAIRCHWHVENSLHWVLDVVYNEDRSTVRKGNAAENMAIIRHILGIFLFIAKPYKVMYLLSYKVFDAKQLGCNLINFVEVNKVIWRM